ncbi:hypothetical protein L2E82_19784 [Cichorium intybus]|uniref:Uncharacterized protein n=1 Tax=Cichorium intybus TaxID=13427 RepID=A0ACB9DRI8_CICIN|nr:hypothetical protein L2E82_19784 [Cichorium intybus]
MGNFNSCFCVQLQKATLIDVQGNLRHVKVPITAAEMMLLEEPGHLISPMLDDLRSNFRLSALRADDLLTNGKLYMLIPAGRLNSFITESELEMIRSGCKSNRKIKKQMKRRRSSKVLPQNEVGDGTVDESGCRGQRMSSSPMWKPVLEPIYE